jgi:pimeloyl-ACP methyl ester carboxylesterase
MQHLQISKFNVLGFSMGGMIAMNLALNIQRYQQNVSCCNCAIYQKTISAIK